MTRAAPPSRFAMDDEPETWTLEEIERANADAPLPDGALETMAALLPGEACTFGGGAVAACRVRRVS